MSYTKQELIELLAPALVNSGHTKSDVESVLETYTITELNVMLQKQTPAAPDQVLNDPEIIRQVETIRAEVRRKYDADPARILEQRQRELQAAEVYRDYYLAQIFRTNIRIGGKQHVAVQNKASENIIVSWLHPGETLTPDWFRKVFQENPTLTNQLQWQSADVLDPQKRKQAAAQRVAHARDVFGIVCRKHNLSLVEANFRLLFDADLLDSEYTADQAITSNAVTLARATETELSQFQRERIEEHNQELLRVAETNPEQLRARVRQEAEQRRSVDQQAEADEALAAAQARDTARGGFPPLPPEITSEVIRNARPDQIKFWIKKYSNSSVTARLQNRG
jgi:hypothetical protein